MSVMQTDQDALPGGAVLPVAALDPGGGWTVDDLDALPDDGLRRELVDGVLLVSRAPRIRHQVVVAALYDLLRASCPPELTVLPGPIGVRKGTERELQPDLSVVDTARLGEDVLSVPPALVVEVASSSTRVVDRTVKREVYADRGVPSYWLVGVEEPGITVLELRGGRYVEVAEAGPEGTVAVTRPFPVTVAPGALVPPRGRGSGGSPDSGLGSADTAGDTGWRAREAVGARGR